MPADRCLVTRPYSPKMLRHRHTRGQVLDLSSEVCPNSVLDKAQVSTGSDVYVSNIRTSWIEQSRLIRCLVEESDVYGSLITHSVVAKTKLYNANVIDSLIHGSTIEGGDFRGAEVINCTVEAGWIGNAKIEGLTIVDPIRIGTGYWTRLPGYFEINNEVASGVIVTESTNGYAYIGCIRKPMKLWIKGSKRFQKVIGWDDGTRELIVETFREWLKR